MIRFIRGLTLALLAALGNAAQEATNPPGKSLFTFQEAMVPMRDGVRLQTVIMAPTGQDKPLPILVKRTCYGIPHQPWTQIPPFFRELARDGYIFVFQNVRGRFKSEGVFLLSCWIDLENPKAVNETTDAYDTIDWLVKNVKGNNGRAGIWGVSFHGVTAGLTLLHPHPALKAISEQAASADLWMNDDAHRYGALRLSYSFEYAVMEMADRNKNTKFAFDAYDGYTWYLNLGPLTNANAKYLHGAIPVWNDIVEHPDYDAHWKKEAWVHQVHATTVPILNVAGFWDQEDPWGPWQIFQRCEASDPQNGNFMVAGPWMHGQWYAEEKADRIGQISFGGHNTAQEFREDIQAPFFRHYLHDEGEKPAWKVATFQTGSNTWHHYAIWPPKEARPTRFYLHLDGTVSFDSPAQPDQAKPYREYVADPANPVPYRQRPISPTYPGGDWELWEVADQRFVEGQPDVLSFISRPLDRDLTVTGAVTADLFASTSGTDCDFVVKLIDVYPEDAEKRAWDPEDGPAPGQYAKSLNGYELPIAMEIRRGRYLGSFEQPRPLVPDRPTAWAFPLRDHDHVFLKGHRIMVQVQSTWFPVIDRNPQTFVPNIYKAAASDFVQAVQRVYCTPEFPSYVVLPVMP